MLKRLLIAGLAVGTLALGASSALAGKPGDPVLFVIAPGQCPQLGADVGVSGTGTETTVVHGSTLTQFASGTAVDTNGKTYTFNYNLTISENAKRLILTDHFNLVGGHGEMIHATFVARFDSHGIFFNQHGDAVSDPGSFEAVCDPL
jgi:hypothetical protein